MTTMPDAEVPPRAVGIVGLGLIGGSLAIDLAAQGVPVLAHDADEQSVRDATRAGVVQAPLGPHLERLVDVDLLVVAVPVDRVPEILAAVAARPETGCVVTDAGSTKRSIVRTASRLKLDARFVGAHPLAGDHRAGWGAARAGLFRDALVYLCPAADTPPATLARVERFWRTVGAHTTSIDAAVHDRLLARTSHLPQVLASALASVHHAAGIDAGQLGAGGRDMTRLAASDPDLWSAILLDNADQLQPALDELEATLAALRASLDRGDAAGLRAWLAAGSGQVPAKKHGADSAPPPAH